METNRINPDYIPAWEDRVAAVLTPKEKKAYYATGLVVWCAVAYSIVRIVKGVWSLKK